MEYPEAANNGRPLHIFQSWSLFSGVALFFLMPAFLSVNEMLLVCAVSAILGLIAAYCLLTFEAVASLWPRMNAWLSSLVCRPKVRLVRPEDIGDSLLVDAGPFSNVSLDYEASGGMSDCLSGVSIVPVIGRVEGDRLFRERRVVDGWLCRLRFSSRPIDGTVKLRML